MTKEEIIEMAKKCGWDNPATNMMPLYEFARLVAKHERDACIALHNHRDVFAPIGHSAWGEAYQDGWIEGTEMYLKAIEARGQE